jgi:hypothetical protein
VELERNSFKPVKLMIDEGMVTGFKSELRIYPKGKSRPASEDSMELTDGNLAFDVDVLHARDFPVPDKQYIVEVALTFFETDVHSGHMWQPWDSKKYKVLWRRTLVASVDPPNSDERS